MKRIKLICLLMLISLVIISCNNTKKTTHENTNSMESSYQISKSTDSTDLVKEIKNLAIQYKEIYEKAAADQTFSTLEVTSHIMEKIGENGYSVVDQNNEINMVHSDQVENFCMQVQDKKDGHILLVVVTDNGGLRCYELETSEGIVEVSPFILTWTGNDPKVECLKKYEAYNWQYTENGYLIFEEYHPPGYDGTSGHIAIRIKPIDDKCREYNRKYIEPIGYSYNNMFITDWSEENYKNLDLYDLFEIIYPIINGKPLQLGSETEGITYAIPKEEFENALTYFLKIDSPTLQQYTVYNQDNKSYRFRERGLYDCCMPQFPKPEVMDYKENEDGTITLTVNAVWEWNDNDHAFSHEVVIRPLSDGGWQYVSNHVIAWDQDVKPSWYCSRLTEDEWHKYYEENKS